MSRIAWRPTGQRIVAGTLTIAVLLCLADRRLRGVEAKPAPQENNSESALARLSVGELAAMSAELERQLKEASVKEHWERYRSGVAEFLGTEPPPPPRIARSAGHPP